jgi:glycosyltransferase involved in cell wall biosynthesis
LQHVAASLAGRLLGKPTLLKVAMANSDLAFHRHGRLMGRANKALVRRFDLYVATTPTIAQEFKDRGLDPARIRLIPNGVDTSVFTPVSCEERIHRRRSMGLPDGQLVTYVGIINSRKNIDGMLRIWSKVCASNHSAHFALIGPIPSENDPFYRDIISFVRNAGLAERVTFMGLRETVVPYLQASDAFLFASRREGMPNSVLEAMSCGLPCVISRQAGLLEIVHDGINGCSMDVEDEEGFARALRRILEDPEQADRIGREARRTIISELSLRSTAERYRELYSRLVV